MIPGDREGLKGHVTLARGARYMIAQRKIVRVFGCFVLFIVVIPNRA